MSRWTDDRIERLASDWLRERGAGPMPDRLVERARMVARRRRTVRAWRAWLALAAVVATLAAGGLLATLAVGQRDVRRPLPSLPAVPPPASVAPSGGPTAGPTRAAGAGLLDQAGIFGGTGLWARRGAELFVSADRGQTWRPLGGLAEARGQAGLTAPPYANDRPAFVLDERHAWLVGRTADSRDGAGGPAERVTLVVCRTADGGATWQATVLDGNFANMDVSIAFADAARGYLLTTSTRMGPGGSALLRTDDGGRTWRVASEPAGRATVLDVTDADTAWIGADPEAGPVDHTLLQVSRDAGASWSAVPLAGLGGAHAGTEAWLLDGPRFFGGGEGALAVGLAGDPAEVDVERTSDGGQTWRLAGRLAANDAVAADVVGRGTWLAGLHRTTDAGASWTRLPFSGPPTGGVPAAVAFWTADAGAVLVPPGEGPTIPAALFVTRDGGASWIAATPPGTALAPPSP